MTPRISVITTIHNRADFLEAAVRSVRTQTREDFEHILYDDGSTDRSLEIAESLARQDPRLRVVQGPHLGCVAALKAAHTHARAPLIGWVDSDDLLVASALEDTAAALDQSPDAGLVFTDHITIDQQSRPIRTTPRTRPPYSPEQLLTDFSSFHFRLFRREAFDACGGIDDSFTASPDYDFCLRASEITRFLHLPKPLYAYRIHSGAISHARRFEQIQNSRRAIENALRRRGLSDRFRLQVEISARFSLVPTTDSMDSPCPDISPKA